MSPEKMLPQATAEEKAVYSTQYRAGDKVVQVLQNRIDVVRSGQCPDHGKRSIQFSGTNEYGWIFRCPGWTEGDVRQRKAQEPTGTHYFANQPAEEIQKLNWELLPKEIPGKGQK